MLRNSRLIMDLALIKQIKIVFFDECASECNSVPILNAANLKGLKMIAVTKLFKRHPDDLLFNMFKIALRLVGAKISELFGPEVIFG